LNRFAHVFLGPDGVNDLQIAIDGNDCEVEHGAFECDPEKVLAHYHHAEPVAERSGKIDVGYLQCVGHDEHQTAEKVEYILIEDQRLLLVLFRGHHGVHDKGVGCRSDDSDDDDGATEVEISTTRRR